MIFPRVSVVVPSYNHEKYISDALESVVNQTFQEYELIIIDDASRDQSVEVINSFINSHSEVPIKFIRHELNQGGVRTLNHLISLAKGELIALINSDDVWLPGKLEIQVNYLDQHPEVSAVFTQALMIDENKKELDQKVFPFSEVFIQKNRTQGEWLRQFFFDQNCLCHPSLLIRRDIYRQIGDYDPRYRQVPDLQMWVRLAKHAKFHIIEQPLVLLRWHSSNTSVINTSNSTRGINELFYIYRDFFEGMPDDVFMDGFKDLFERPEASGSQELACEKAFIYFKPTNPTKPIYYNIGLDKLYRLLGDLAASKVLFDKYYFSHKEFFALGGTKFFDETFYLVTVPNVYSTYAPPISVILKRYLTHKKNQFVSLVLKSPSLHKIARYVSRRLRGKSV